MPEQRWIVEYYTDARGRGPALEFIRSLQGAERAAVLRVIALLREFGTALGGRYVKPVEGLWELRAGSSRVFYVAHTGQRFILLHGYRKKGQKAPRKEIEMAKRRWVDFLMQEQG